MMDALTTVLAEDGLEAVLEQVLKGLEHHIVGEDVIGYRCKCSRERVASAILGIGESELKKMVDEGRDVDVSCQFCDTVYTFTRRISPRFWSRQKTIKNFKIAVDNQGQLLV